MDGEAGLKVINNAQRQIDRGRIAAKDARTETVCQGRGPLARWAAKASFGADACELVFMNPLLTLAIALLCFALPLLCFLVLRSPSTTVDDAAACCAATAATNAPRSCASGTTTKCGTSTSAGPLGRAIAPFFLLIRLPPRTSPSSQDMHQVPGRWCCGKHVFREESPGSAARSAGLFPPFPHSLLSQG